MLQLAAEAGIFDGLLQIAAGDDFRGFGQIVDGGYGGPHQDEYDAEHQQQGDAAQAEGDVANGVGLRHDFLQRHHQSHIPVLPGVAQGNGLIVTDKVAVLGRGLFHIGPTGLEGAAGLFRRDESVDVEKIFADQPVFLVGHHQPVGGQQPGVTGGVNVDACDKFIQLSQRDIGHHGSPEPPVHHDGIGCRGHGDDGSVGIVVGGIGKKRFSRFLGDGVICFRNRAAQIGHRGILGAIRQKTPFSRAAGGSPEFCVSAVESVGFPHGAATIQSGAVGVNPGLHGDERVTGNSPALLKRLAQPPGQSARFVDGHAQKIPNIIAVLGA